jgi:hypothetical protein
LTTDQARTTRPLRSTRVTRLHHYYGAPRPCPTATVLCPLRFLPLGGLPLAAALIGAAAVSGARFQRSAQEPEPGSRHLYAGRRLGGKQVAPRLLPRQTTSSVLTSSHTYDTFPVVHSRSPSWLLPAAFLGATFPQRSPPRPLCRRSLRWFGASPCRAAPAGLPPSPVQHRFRSTCLLHRSSFHVRCARVLCDSVVHLFQMIPTAFFRGK